MNQNLDTQGRVFRLITSVLLLAFAWWQNSWTILAVAAFTFYEALAGWCVLFALTGKNSCPITSNTTGEKQMRGELMIDSKRLGVAGGILWSLSLFTITIISLYTGYASKWMVLLEDIIPGFTVSWAGGIKVMVYGFIGAYFFLLFLGWIYNKLSKELHFY